MSDVENIIEEDEDFDMGEPSNPYWQCECCGFIDNEKPMPKDRDAFYKRIHEKGSPHCPKCKSEFCFVPVGF